MSCAGQKVTFCSLIIGDRFTYGGATWIVIELQRAGSCGCVPHSNSVQEGDKSIGALFNCSHEVEKL